MTIAQRGENRRYAAAWQRLLCPLHIRPISHQAMKAPGRKTRPRVRTALNMLPSAAKRKAANTSLAWSQMCSVNEAKMDTVTKTRAQPMAIAKKLAGWYIQPITLKRNGKRNVNKLNPQ